MSDTGIQSPLGVNVVASTILNEGLSINPVAERMIGSSKTNQYYTPGSIVNDTCLSWATQSINGAYNNNNFLASSGLADVEIIGDLVGASYRIGILTVKQVLRGSLLPRLRLFPGDVPFEVPSFQMIGQGNSFKITEMGNTDWARVDVYGFPEFYNDIKPGTYTIVENPETSPGVYQTDFTTIGSSSNEPGTVFSRADVLPPTLPNFNQAYFGQRQLKKLDYFVGSVIVSNGGGIPFTIPGKGTSQTITFMLGNLVSGDGNSPGSQWQVFYIGASGNPERWVLYETQDVTEYLNLTDKKFRFLINQNAHIDKETYNNLLAMGQSRIPALSNSLPPTYLINDPSNVWEGQATSGYAIQGPVGQGQEATWFPYNTDNPNYSVTQWGFLRCLALQAWNVFNWQGSSPLNEEPEYKNYATQFQTLDGFISQSNRAIFALRNSVNFLDGTFSNMNDLITGDITGVSLSTQAFGQDLTNLGKALQLTSISKFGLPSVLLQTLQQNNGLIQSVILALLTSGLNQNEINQIASGNITATIDQEQKIYGAFNIIGGTDLQTILKTLGCKTKRLIRLTDLLNIKKMFPISYTSLTVPIYNTSPGPTNSKTYYLLFVDRELNPQLVIPRIKEIVGVISPVEEPPPPSPPALPTPVILEEIITEVALPVIPAPPPTPDIPIPPVVQPPPVTVPVYPPPSPPPPAIPPSTGGGGGCVVLDAYLPTVETRLHNGKSVEKAWQIENDFDILLADEQLKSTKGKVVKAMIDFQPCVKIVTASGIRLSCSTTAPILTKNKGYVEAPKLFGEQIAVMRNDIAFYDEVVGIEDIGYKHVRVIDTGDNSFWAGDIQNAYVLHHNARISDALDYDKK